MAIPVLKIRVDWDNDGTFSGPLDDVSASVLSKDYSLSWTRGRSADFSAEATGSASFVLRNDQDQFTPDRNLVDNPSFEGSVSGWTATAPPGFTNPANSIVRLTSDAASGAGTSCAEITFTNSLSARFVRYQVLYPFKAGVSYSLSFYARVSSGTTGSSYQSYLGFDNSDKAVTAQSLASTYARKTMVWTPSANRDYAYIGLGTTTTVTGVVHLDAVQVNVGSTATTYIEAPTKGQLVPGRPVHIYATYGGVDYAQFFGFIERLSYDPKSKTVTITCYDVLRKMSEADVVVGANNVVQRTARDFRRDVLDDFERGNRNLIADPSFEIGVSGWDITTYAEGGPTLTRVTGDAAPGTGTACAEYVAMATNNRAIYHPRMAPVFYQGSVYRLSMYLRTLSGTQDWGIGIYNQDIINHTAERWVTVNSSWQRYTVTFTVDTTVRVDLLFGLNIFLHALTPGTIRIDGITLTRGQALYPYSDTGTGRWPNWIGNSSFDGQDLVGWMDGWKNLVPNPSFEASTSGWQTTNLAGFVSNGAGNLTRVSTDPMFGSWHGKWTTSAGGGSGFWGSVPGTFKAGVSYHFSAWFKAPGTMAPGFFVHWKFGSMGTPTDKVDIAGGGGWLDPWQRLYGVWTPSADRNDAVLAMEFLSNAYEPDGLRIDGIQVTPLASPSDAPPAYLDTGPGGGGTPTLVTTTIAPPTGAKYGSRVQSVTTSPAALSGRVYDFNQQGAYFVAGVSYTLSLWLYPNSSMPYKLGVGAIRSNGTTDEASTTGTATANVWTKVAVTWTPSADYTSGQTPKVVLAFIYQTDTATRTFYVDGVRLTPGVSIDDYEMAHWLLDTSEADVYLGTAMLSGSALSSLNQLNGLTLSRHWIKPSMASPWYTYNTRSRDAVRTSAETINDDLQDMSVAEIDRSAITNVVPVQYAAGVEYYSDEASVVKYGARPSTPIGNSAFLPNRTSPDLLGPALLARYKDPRARPEITVENRWLTQLQRDLDDLVTVNFSRLNISGGRYLILRLTTTVSEAGNRWVTQYALEESAT